MNKFRKSLAMISSAVIAMSLAMTSVSAGGYSQIVFYDDYPTLEDINYDYNGILVTMPDGEMPVAEELGLENCNIVSYNPDTTVFGMETLYNAKTGRYLGYTKEIPKGSESSYLVYSDDLTEDNAIELVKKLKIRGIVSTAEIKYNVTILRAGMAISNKGTESESVNIRINSNLSINNNDNIHTSITESEFVIDSSYEYYNSNTNSYVLSYDLIYDKEKNTNYRMVYESAKELIDSIVAANSDVKSADISFIAPVSSPDINTGLLNVEPLWGDATNDDKIDLYDAIGIAKYMLDNTKLDSDSVLLADFNRDGKTNLYDVIGIAKELLDK